MLDKNGPEQNQDVSGNSTAVQAKRDVNFTIVQTGLTLKDVQTACDFFLEHNFPRLQEAGRLVAEQYVKEFSNTFAQQLQENAAKVLVEKFSDPDVQASMNDAVKACARKGENASPDLLSKLLVHRMGENTPFLDTVLSEAIHVVPKLSKEQIAFLVYVHYIRGVFFDVSDVKGLEQSAVKVFPIIKPGIGLSKAQKLHLQYSGAMALDSNMSGDIYEGVFKHYREKFGMTEISQFKAVLKFDAPTYNSLLERFEENELFQPGLSSVGLAIALTMIKQVISIDLGIWLK